MDCFFLGMAGYIIEPCVARNKEERGGGIQLFFLLLEVGREERFFGECPVPLILSELSEAGAIWGLDGALGRVWVDEEPEGGEH